MHCSLIGLTICRILVSHNCIYIASVYIPPNVNLDVFEDFIDALDVFLLSRWCVVIGDLTYQHLMYLDLMIENLPSLYTWWRCLGWVNTISNHDGRLLDLVFGSADLWIFVTRNVIPFVNENLLSCSWYCCPHLFSSSYFKLSIQQ